MRRRVIVTLCLSFVLAGAAGVLDTIFPLPALDGPQFFARLVVDKGGKPLRAFADNNGVWRYPVALGDVSPNYLEALLAYEDRWYRWHPGVNPFALVRAAWQNLNHDDIVSGGSTLTMQVARLIDPHSRSISGKLKQMLRALQLEWHYTKDEILTLYLNRAPFGGAIEGVQAASYMYLGRSVATLSDAEAALLVVLPQAPSRNRPDRYASRAQQARDKVLERLTANGVWEPRRAAEARQEPVWGQYHAQPLDAPLLSRRVVGLSQKVSLVRTNIDVGLQQGVADLLRNRVGGMPPATSAAVLVVENRTMAVRAYVGSADFSNDSRFGHVDMVQAVRSPGSTLKPFVYGMAIDAGLIHSQSLLVDAPSDFGDYRPENFDHGFSGPVSVSEALQRSLNVPAVQVLDKLGPHVFLSQLRHAGMNVRLPRGAESNLALGLGGAGTTLEDLVGMYSALANDGYAGKVRLLESDPLWQRRVLSAGAAWIIREILATNSRIDRPAAHLLDYSADHLAWKTGTSYGFRDSWAIGVTTDYTIGVWVGRPDGTPLPGYFGAVAAAPILFTIADHVAQLGNAVPALASYASRAMPATVSEAEVCWPLGGLVSDTPLAHCHRRKHAFLLDGVAPPTFADDEERDWGANPVSLWINPQTGRRVDEQCPVARRELRRVALWPKAVEAWVEPAWRRYRQIPLFDPACPAPPEVDVGTLRIAGVRDGSILRPASGSQDMPRVELQALGGVGRQHWFINGELTYVVAVNGVQAHRFARPGEYTLTVVDEQGRSDESHVTVVID